MDLDSAYQEVGMHYLFTSEAAQAIPDFEAERRLLKDTAARPGQPPSRKAQVQVRLAGADLNLWNACDPEMLKHTELRRALMIEAFEICDKLSLVDPLPRFSAVRLCPCEFVGCVFSRTRERRARPGSAPQERGTLGGSFTCRPAASGGARLPCRRPPLARR